MHVDNFQHSCILKLLKDTLEPHITGLLLYCVYGFQ